jgi:coenzyme F420-reducing hydrogenase gamma subunit
MAECPNVEVNMRQCNCSYSYCDRKGKCCECIRYHRSHGELPGCYFPDDVEKTYDRSIERFIELNS